MIEILYGLGIGAIVGLVFFWIFKEPQDDEIDALIIVGIFAGVGALLGIFAPIVIPILTLLGALLVAFLLLSFLLFLVIVFFKFVASIV